MHYHHKSHQNYHNAYFTIMHNIIHHMQQLINVTTINKQPQTTITHPMHIHKHAIVLIHYNINTSLSNHNDLLIIHTCHHIHLYSGHTTTTQLFHQELA